MEMINIIRDQKVVTFNNLKYWENNILASGLRRSPMWNVAELRLERTALRTNHPYASESGIVLKSDMFHLRVSALPEYGCYLARTVMF